LFFDGPENHDVDCSDVGKDAKFEPTARQLLAVKYTLLSPNSNGFAHGGRLAFFFGLGDNEKVNPQL